jgi:hypothetical protein
MEAGRQAAHAVLSLVFAKIGVQQGASLKSGMNPNLSCRIARGTNMNSASDQGIEDGDLPADSVDYVQEEAEGGEGQPVVESLYDLEPEDQITTNPLEAVEEGYPYTPPTDPPVLPSDDLEGAEIAVGFASSTEESSPDEEILPARVERGDLELERHVYTVLRNNSETQNLTDIRVSVRDGVVFIQGTVQSDDDIAIVDDIVNDLDGVIEVRNYLRLED